MKFCFAVSLCALCLYASPPLPLNVFSVPILDTSGAGTPFQVDGKMTLRESARANQLEWSWGEKVNVKNISDKPILLFIATITESGRYSAPRHTAPGDGPTYRLEDDRFSNEKLIEPGESFVIRDTKPGVPDVACCINPLAGTHDPFAEYHVHFVQFADGSVFGDPAEARGSLAIRQIIRRGLHDLYQSYEQGDESGFVARLNTLRSYVMDPSLAPSGQEQPPFFATAICRGIIAKYDSDGTKGALEKTREILNITEKHAAMISR